MGGSPTTPLRNTKSGQANFFKRLKALAAAVTALGKVLLAVFAYVLLCFVARDAYRERNVVFIDTIVVPKFLEERGYSSQAVGDRVRNEIDKIKSVTKTYAKEEDFAAAGDAELPDIEVPKSGISYRAIVRFLQDAASSPRITGEITCISDSPAQPSAVGLCAKGFVATVRITHSGRTLKAPTFESVSSSSPDPERLMPELAQGVLRLIDPYLLALYVDKFEKNQDKEKELIFECDGPFVKWGRLRSGNLLMDQEKYSGAIEKFSKALRIDPDFSIAYTDRGLALSNETPPDLAGAIGDYKEAIALHSDNSLYELVHWMSERLGLPDQNPAHAAAYNSWAYTLRNESPPDFQGAIDKYRRATTIDPSFAEAYNNWCSALNEESPPHVAEAIEKCEEALESDPKLAEAYVGLGNALSLKSPPDLDGAIDNYKQALEVNPKLSVAFAGLANALSLKSPPDLDGAIDNYRKALANDGKLTVVYAGLGNALTEEHRWPEALTVYCRYLAFEPKNQDVRNAIDSTIDKLTNLKAAYANFERSNRSEANNWNVKYVLDRMRAKLSRPKS